MTFLCIGSLNLSQALVLVKVLQTSQRIDVAAGHPVAGSVNDRCLLQSW